MIKAQGICTKARGASYLVNIIQTGLCVQAKNVPDEFSSIPVRKKKFIMLIIEVTICLRVKYT